MGGPAESRLRWIEAGDNPYGMRVLDCRQLTQDPHGWVSVTRHPEVAETFGSLRSSDGRQHRGQYPANAFTYECDLRYPGLDLRRDGPIFRARVMEDKWDIFFDEGRIYFARSWSGKLLLVAGVAFDERLSVGWIAAPDLGEPVDPPFPVREFDFLVKSHLYRRRVPNPVPAGYSTEPIEVAAFSMHRYGRWASYASFDDTTVFNPWAEPTI